jgi:transposase InsO family protein
MKMIMKLDNLSTISQMEDFLNGSQSIAFAVATTKDERYSFVERVLRRFSYSRLKRGDRGVVIRFLGKVCGYSRQQLTRMIQRYLEEGELRRYQKTANGFEQYFTAEDVRLLAQLDQRHDTPNGFMVKKLCERAFHEHDEVNYIRLSRISVSHIYNLRKSAGYKKYRCHYEKTKSPKCLHIGERRKPQANGKPGYIRIDTVHQGDLDGCKGVYHINAVDEVTQFEIVISVEKISEYYLIPVLGVLLEAFPFKIINFHSDNGSEYVNKTVATLLKKLLIEFTKSRARQSNDNALAEGKNAAVVRKIFGYHHIPQCYAEEINKFNQTALNPYINYHRPCLYPTVTIDEKGKQKKKYEYKNMMTPYEKFKFLQDAEQYLKEGITFKKLDDIADAMTDNEAADHLQQQRRLLFKHIDEDCKKRA